jgi:hypothetical protein
MERNVFTSSQLEWLAALESGEWKQGKARLCTTTSGQDFFCCLGVRAQQMQIPFTTEPLSGSCGTFRKYENGSDGTSTLFAPRAVAHDLDLLSNEGALSGNDSADPDYEGYTLAALNDNGMSFAKIAAFIRANPWRVFRNFDKPAGAS